MFFPFAVPVRKMSTLTLIPCNNIVTTFSYSRVSLSACNDLYHYFTKSLTSLSLMHCCKVNNNKKKLSGKDDLSVSDYMDIDFPLMTAEAKCQQFASHSPFPHFPFLISHFLVPTFRVT